MRLVDRSMAYSDPPPEDDLSRLRRRIKAVREKDDPASTDRSESAATLAMRFGGEFGAAVLVGALLGYGADFLFSTSPWGLVIGLLLGFCAGVVNMVRVAQNYAHAHPVDANAPSIPDDDPEDGKN